MVRCRSSVIVLPVIVLVLLGSVLLAAGCTDAPRQTPQSTPPLVPGTVPVLTTIAQSPVISNATDVNVTLNSIIRTNLIHGAHPLDNTVFIVVDITLENHRLENYSFTPSMIKLNKHAPHNEKMVGRLENPVSFGPVPPGGTVQGEVIFGVWEVAQELTLELHDADGSVLFSKRINEGPLTGYSTAKSEKLQDLMKNTDFSDVVRQLDTPLLAAQYINERFTYYDHHDGRGYPPEEFFVTRKGDCCEFSWFFAYVLKAHGVDASMVSFKYYNTEGEYDGHVVTVFTEKDGQLRYATIPDLTKFRNASSIDDVLAQEKARMNFRELISYRIHQPLSTDSCHYK